MKTVFCFFGRGAWGCAFVMALSFLLAGCGKKDAAADAIDADANGYVCQKCQAKFYTERTVFAEFCPSCKGVEIEQVVCYVCDKDGSATVFRRIKGAVPCAKCQAGMTSIRLAREADLRPWGATKKSRAEVCRH